MAQYEYKRISNKADGIDIEAELNKYAADGWRLAAANPPYFILEREVITEVYPLFASTPEPTTPKKERKK